MTSFKAAAYQMTVGVDTLQNFLRIQKAVATAAESGARVIALPECAISGYPPHHFGSADEIDALAIAETNEKVRELAGRHGIWIVVGTILISSEGLLNSALVISDEGELVGRYDKIHLMPEDKKFFVPGTGARVFHAGEAPFGVLICYDARFPEPFRYLRERGARFIVTISNACGGDTWKLPVLEGTYRARASENSCFVIAVNAAGPLQMATSRICDPLGLDLASAEVDREELIFADVDLSETETGYFYDRRSDLFEVVPKFDV